MRRSSSLSLWCFFVLVFCVPGICRADAGQNLVKSPGFEAAENETAEIAGWNAPDLPGVEPLVVEDAAASGARCAGVRGLDPDKQSRYVQAWRQNVAPLPEGSLWFSVRVKCRELQSGRINILHKDADGTVLRNQGIAGFSGTHGWREKGGLIEPEPGTKSLQIVMGLQKSTGTVWFDDVSVVPFKGVAEQFGHFSFTPAEPQPAGASRPVEFGVTVGQCGLEAGGQILIKWDRWRVAREFKLRNLRVDTDGQQAQFDAVVPPVQKNWPPVRKPADCVVTLKSGKPLEAGTKVRVNGTLQYSAHSNILAHVSALIRPGADREPRPLEGRCELRSKGGTAEELRCITLARPVAGTAGRVTVAAVDRHGNPAQDFRGTVELSCNTSVRLPEDYSFSAADAGSHDFPIAFPEEQVSRVSVSCGDMKATSNPILPRAPSAPGVYFGDIHSHCRISADAIGDPDRAYEYARCFWGLDFAALSDHSPRGRKWETGMKVANRHNQTGRFVTLLGFEWSDSRRGHRNIYYRADSGPEKPGVPHNMTDWWEFLGERDIRALTVPHHPNTQSTATRPDGSPVWGPMDWSAINHTYQRIVEMCQNRGSFEVPGGPRPELRVTRKDRGSSVQTALEKGHRLGFIASTDTHTGRPGTGVGRCAVLTNEFSRTGIWDALYDRACYATTGSHILLFFTVNGHQMGSEIQVKNPSAERRVSWRVIGTDRLKSVELLKCNEVAKSWQGRGQRDLSGEFTFAGSVEDTEWYYLRVIQEDDEMAWSSPVWVNVP